MEPLLWLLLPVAAASGWGAARLSSLRQQAADSETTHNNQNIIRGLNYFLSQESDKAVHSLVSSLEVNDDTVETHLILGSIFRDRGEMDRAIRIHQNIIARPELSSSQKNHALLQLGLDFFRSGLLDRAEHIFLQLAEQDKKNPRVYDYLSHLYEQEREWEKAVKNVKILNKLEASSHASRLANYYCEWVESLPPSQREKGLKLAAEAVDADKSCVRALLQNGDILASLGRDKDAKKTYLEALKRNPHFSPVIIGQLFKLYAQGGDLKGFRRFVEENMNIECDPSARFFLVNALEQLGDSNELLSMLTLELKRPESSPYIVKKYLDHMADTTEGEVRDSFISLSQVLETRIGTYMACRCSQCGFEGNDLFWQCPSCKAWGSVQPYQHPMEYQ